MGHLNSFTAGLKAEMFNESVVINVHTIKAQREERYSSIHS